MIVVCFLAFVFLVHLSCFFVSYSRLINSSSASRFLTTTSIVFCSCYSLVCLFVLADWQRNRATVSHQGQKERCFLPTKRSGQSSSPQQPWGPTVSGASGQKAYLVHPWFVCLTDSSLLLFYYYYFFFILLICYWGFAFCLVAFVLFLMFRWGGGRLLK